MFVAYDPAGEIAGVVTVGECDRAGEKVAALGLLAVDKASRRQGLGTALMRAAMEWTAAHKYLHMEIITQGTNDAALALYMKFGFEIAKVCQVLHSWLEY